MKKSEQNGNAVEISSGKRLTIETIDVFIASIRRGLAEAETVLIEFDPDVEVDITSLQVFCSACRTARAMGKKFGFRGPMPQALTDLNLEAGSERHQECEYMNAWCFRQSGGVNAWQN
jgi:hypothetical protein